MEHLLAVCGSDGRYCGSASRIVRFFTVPKVRDARISAGWALLFISILYTSVPGVAAFARLNLIKNVQNNDYATWTAECTAEQEAAINAVRAEGGDAARMPCAGNWFATWEKGGLIGWMDKNGDGKIQFANGAAFAGKPSYTDATGQSGERMLSNAPTAAPAGQAIENEPYVDRDIIVLANPEIARLQLGNRVDRGGRSRCIVNCCGSVVGNLCCDFSRPVGSRDLQRQRNWQVEDERSGELMAARRAAVAAILVAGYLGINPPGFVAQVVAFAFGLAAASFFPVIINGIFDKRMNREGAIAGMLVGLIFTFTYIVLNVFVEKNGFIIADIKPTGIGTIGMILHFVVAYFVSRATAAPPQEIQQMVEDIRIPRGAGAAHAH